MNYAVKIIIFAVSILAVPSFLFGLYRSEVYIKNQASNSIFFVVQKVHVEDDPTGQDYVVAVAVDSSYEKQLDPGEKMKIALTDQWEQILIEDKDYSLVYPLTRLKNTSKEYVLSVYKNEQGKLIVKK